jgi:hypothetical protein
VLEISQRNGQHALGDAVNRPVQFPKAHPTVAQRHQKQDCPFVADPRQDVCDPAAIRERVLWLSGHAANIRSITPYIKTAAASARHKGGGGVRLLGSRRR